MKSVTVKESVSFNGPADTTLLATVGDIELDLETRCIVGKPRNGKPVIMVPLENVRCMIPMDEAMAAQHDAEKDLPRDNNGMISLNAPTLPVAHDPTPAPDAPRGVLKFERGADGKVTEKIV